jgi:hypothetical protein
MGYPLIPQGKRAVLAGRTGAGKTTLARWLMLRSPGFWIILNQKGDEALARMGPTADMGQWERIIEKGHKFAVIQPPPGMDKEEIDGWIYEVSESWENVNLCVDELYYLSSNGRAGPGLTGWLTRGRSRGQSFLGNTQRPAWVSRFVFSESDYLCSLALNLRDDRKRMVEFTGHEKMREKLPPRYWRWYDVENDELTTYGPVPIR